MTYQYVIDNSLGIFHETCYFLNAPHNVETKRTSATNHDINTILVLTDRLHVYEYK